jgi:hypothetical protein
MIPLLSKAVREEMLTLVRPHPDGRKTNYGPAALMVFGQLAGAAGFIGVQYAVSLGSATVVNALQAVQYAAIVLIAWFGGHKLAVILKEDISPRTLLQKGLAILLVGVGLAFVSWLPVDAHTEYGYTWSAPYARDLGLDPEVAFEKTLTDLQPTEVRLPAYWSEIEKQQGNFDFRELDHQIELANLHHVHVELAIGARLPRWPECWVPDWAKTLDADSRTQAQLDYVKAVYEHEKENEAIRGFQVENEPMLNSFQTCPGLTRDLALKEIRFVRGEEAKRAVKRPVATTDSGELSSWLHFNGETDELGVSVYRVVTNPMFGIVYWILPADFYSTKAFFLQHWISQVYVSEFQMEPWANQPLTETPIETQVKQFSLKQMNKNFNYASRLEMPRVDFWGIEWWVWAGEKQNHPEYWEAAKTFFAAHHD